MSNYLDFAEIKANHCIEAVADRLGLDLKKLRNGQLRGECFSGAEGDRKLVVTPEKGLFYSFALNEGGDVIKLVSLVNKVSPKDAAKWIVGDTVPEKKPVVASALGGKPSEGFSPLSYLEHDHPAVVALGFDAETAERLGIGHAPRGILKGTVAVPIRLEDGTLSGYLGLTEIEKLPPQWK